MSGDWSKQFAKEYNKDYKRGWDSISSAGSGGSPSPKKGKAEHGKTKSVKGAVDHAQYAAANAARHGAVPEPAAPPPRQAFESAVAGITKVFCDSIVIINDSFVADPDAEPGRLQHEVLVTACSARFYKVGQTNAKPVFKQDDSGHENGPFYVLWSKQTDHIGWWLTDTPELPDNMQALSDLGDYGIKAFIAGDDMPLAGKLHVPYWSSKPLKGIRVVSAAHIDTEIDISKNEKIAELEALLQTRNEELESVNVENMELKDQRDKLQVRLDEAILTGDVPAGAGKSAGKGKQFKGPGGSTSRSGWMWKGAHLIVAIMDNEWDAATELAQEYAGGDKVGYLISTIAKEKSSGSYKTGK